MADLDELFKTTDEITRKFIQDKLMGQRIRGVWTSKLIQIAKDVAAWGAHELRSTNAIDTIVNSAGNMAALSLGLLAPEAIPVVAALD